MGPSFTGFWPKVLRVRDPGTDKGAVPRHETPNSFENGVNFKSRTCLKTLTMIILVIIGANVLFTF